MKVNNNNSNVENPIEEQKTNDNLGSKIYNTYSANLSYLTFYNLGIVHVDYIEMKRMTERIKEINVTVASTLGQLAAALSALASLVGASIDISEFNMSSLGLESNFSWAEEDDFSGLSEIDSASNTYVLGISDNISNAINIMYTQINSYKEQTGLTEEELKRLNEMVEQVIENPHLTYYDSVTKERVDILYNDLLNDYKKEELLSAYGIVDLNDLIISSNNNNTVNIYKYIENNLQDEMQLIGVTTGKEYLRYILDTAEEGALTNREKAVRGAIALNKFLADNNITANYAYGAGHTNFYLDNLSQATDCSSYVSVLIKEGNPSFQGGTTSSFLSDYTKLSNVDINNISLGDVLTSSSHARFVIGIDVEKGTVITTENVNAGIGSKVREYTIEELINTGYKTYHVDYGD